MRYPLVILIGSCIPASADTLESFTRSLLINGIAALPSPSLLYKTNNIGVDDLKPDQRCALRDTYQHIVNIYDSILVLGNGEQLDIDTWDELLFAVAQRKNIYFLNPLSNECDLCLRDLVQLDIRMKGSVSSECLGNCLFDRNEHLSALILSPRVPSVSFYKQTLTAMQATRNRYNQEWEEHGLYFDETPKRSY